MSGTEYSSCDDEEVSDESDATSFLSSSPSSTILTNIPIVELNELASNEGNEIISTGDHELNAGNNGNQDHKDMDTNGINPDGHKDDNAHKDTILNADKDKDIKLNDETSGKNNQNFILGSQLIKQALDVHSNVNIPFSTNQESVESLKDQLLVEKSQRIKAEQETELEKKHRMSLEQQLQDLLKNSMERQWKDSETIRELQKEVLVLKNNLQLCKQRCVEQSLKGTSFSLSEFKIGDNQFQCNQCSNSTIHSEVTMILHLINHSVSQESHLETGIFQFKNSNTVSSPKLYKCPFCGSCFNYIEIYSHIYKYHTIERPFKCHECHVYCAHINDLREHEQTVHDGLLMKVSHDLPISANINHHSSVIATSKKGRPRKNSADRSRYNPYSYSQQATSNKTNLSHFKYLPSTSNSNSNLSNRDNDDEIICLEDEEKDLGDLGEDYSEKRKILAPKKVVKMQEEFKCSFSDCIFTTNSREKLDFHLTAHTKSKYKCPYCPFVANTINDIHKHITKSKKHDSNKIYECKECDFGTNCLTAFKDHLKFHFGRKDMSTYIDSMFRNEHNKTT